MPLIRRGDLTASSADDELTRATIEHDPTIAPTPTGSMT
jgi:hypothetical protein